MAQATAARAYQPTASAEAKDHSRRRPVDLVQLARQTFGDRALELEILRLFQSQAPRLLRQIEAAGGDERRRQAHRLNGSARSLGAGRVAVAAEAVECAAEDAGAEAALAELAAAVAEAGAFIERLLDSAA